MYDVYETDEALHFIKLKANNLKTSEQVFSFFLGRRLG